MSSATLELPAPPNIEPLAVRTKTTAETLKTLHVRAGRNIGPLLGPLQDIKGPQTGDERFLFSQKAASEYLDNVNKFWPRISSNIAAVQDIAKLCSYITDNEPSVTVQSPHYRKWPEVRKEADKILDKIAALAKPAPKLLRQ